MFSIHKVEISIFSDGFTRFFPRFRMVCFFQISTQVLQQQRSNATTNLFTLFFSFMEIEEIEAFLVLNKYICVPKDLCDDVCQRP
jgi:hypothetical protein